MNFVLDGSTALRWCFISQQTTESVHALGLMKKARVFVPSVWPLEVANAISREVNKKSITISAATQFFGLLETFDITVAAAEKNVSLIFDNLRKHALTSYDASYIELALRLNLPLVTQDDRMRAAAQRAGITLLV